MLMISIGDTLATCHLFSEKGGRERQVGMLALVCFQDLREPAIAGVAPFPKSRKRHWPVEGENQFGEERPAKIRGFLRQSWQGTALKLMPIPTNFNKG